MRSSGCLGLGIVVALLRLALAGDSVSGYRFDAQNEAQALEGPSRAHWLGTDILGRDVLARVAEGAQVSLVVAAGSTALALLLGVVYGAISGFAGGRLDGAMMRAVDVAYALPDVLVIILLSEVLNALLADTSDQYRRVLALTLALAGIGWIGIARLVRGLELQAREEVWVEAARALGVTPVRVLWRHVLPNVSAPILVAAALRIPHAIVTESTVSFIGLGIAPRFARLGCARRRRLRGDALLPLSDFFPEPGDPRDPGRLSPARRIPARADREQELGLASRGRLAILRRRFAPLECGGFE